MKTLEQIKQIIQNHKETLRTKYGVKEIGIFGSCVRGDQREKSDIDILVEFQSLPDIFQLIDLEDYLARLLRNRVDLVRKRAVRPELKDIILKETVYV